MPCGSRVVRDVQQSASERGRKDVLNNSMYMSLSAENPVFNFKKDIFRPLLLVTFIALLESEAILSTDLV